jgi:hypothetical protein
VTMTLVRKDDPEQTVTLIRWQEWPHGRNGFSGWWGISARMILNHQTPCMFRDSAWQLQEARPQIDLRRDK